MLKLRKDPLSLLFTSKNGVSSALLKSPHSISAIGAFFSFGAEDSAKSGQSFLTLQAKLFDSIGSPENMFRFGITPIMEVKRDHSHVLVTFLRESEKQANDVLQKLFSNTPPSRHSLGMARKVLAEAEVAGEINTSCIFESAACAASYNEPCHRVEVFNDRPYELSPNNEILANLGSSALLFGSDDQENNLRSLAEKLGTYIPKKRKQSVFNPGTFSKKSSKVVFRGNTREKYPDMELCVFSFPSVSYNADDFLAYKIIEKIFGGGSSFSSEGMGVGANSLLYTNAISFSTEFINSYFFPYEKNGLFSFGLKASPDAFRMVSRKLAHTAKKAFEINDELFEGAKEQAVFGILKETEKIEDRFSNFALQNSIWGEAKETSSIVEAIRSVPKSQVLKCLEKTFSSPPSVSIIGSTKPEELQESWARNFRNR